MVRYIYHFKRTVQKMLANFGKNIVNFEKYPIEVLNWGYFWYIYKYGRNIGTSVFPRKSVYRIKEKEK